MQTTIRRCCRRPRTMTLSGQSPIGKIKRPGSRTTVFSFVARRVGGGGSVRRRTTPMLYRTWKPTSSTTMEHFGLRTTGAVKCPERCVTATTRSGSAGRARTRAAREIAVSWKTTATIRRRARRCRGSPQAQSPVSNERGRPASWSRRSLARLRRSQPTQTPGNADRQRIHRTRPEA